MAQFKPLAGKTTRNVIVESSYQLLTEHGYYVTSMRDIAARVRITDGSIYYHFTDKEQIIRNTAQLTI